MYVAFLVHFSQIYTDAMVTGTTKMADAKIVTPNFLQLWLRAIGCNVLVCIAVFQASLAKDVVSKVVASWFPIFVFVSAGFEHVVADMFLVGDALMNANTAFGVGKYIWKGIIGAFLGNIVGAALLALPLVYLHGSDDVDPAAISPDATVQGSRRGSDGDEKWNKDIEAQISPA